MTNQVAFASKQTPRHNIHRVNPLVAVAALVVPLTVLAGCSRDSKPGLMEHQVVELGRGVPTFYFEGSEYSLAAGSFTAIARQRIEADAKKLGVPVNQFEADVIDFVTSVLYFNRRSVSLKSGSYDEAVFKATLFSVVSGMTDAWNKRECRPITPPTCAKFSCFLNCAIADEERKTTEDYGSLGHFSLSGLRSLDFPSLAISIFNQLAAQSAVRIGGGTSINSEGNFQTD